MPDSYDRDRLPVFVHLIDNDVVSNDEPAQTWVHLVREATAQEWLFGEDLDPVEKILHHADCRCGVFVGNEVEKLRGPLQGGIGPEDAVGHLLITIQKTGPGLVVRDDSARFDIGQSTVNVSEELQLTNQRLIAGHVHKDRRASSFLCKHDRPSRILHLLEQTLRSRLEI